MNMRMTPIVAMMVVLGLAACQDEGEGTESTDTEQSGEAAEEEDPALAEGEPTAVEEDTLTEAAGDGTPESGAEEVERETTETGDASQEATDEALDAAREGETPTTGAENTATDAASEEGVVGSGADEDGTLDEILTPDGYDSDRVIAAIDESDLDDARKDELRELARTASEDPSQMDAALETLRAELLGDDGADAGDITGPDRDFAAGPGSLFAPDGFGGGSEAAIEGASLTGMRTAIFAEPDRAAVE